MATERVVVEFDAEVREYQESLDQAIKSNEELERSAKQGADKSENAYKNAARKRAQLIEREKKLLKELRRGQQLAFDPKTVDLYNRKIRESESRLRSLQQVGKKSGSALKSVFGAVAGGVGVAVAGAGIAALGSKAIKAASDYESLRVSFNTFLGDAKKGEKVLKDLDKFSIKTPFTPEQVQQAGKALLAFGIQQEDLIDTLSRVGDVSSATGKDFNELAVIYGKAKVQGTLFAEDINQLTEAGVPIIQEFAEQFGTTEENVKKLGSQGLITFENLEQGFISLTSEGGKFFNLTSQLSQTTAGRFSTLQGKVTELARDIGAKLLPAVNSLLDLFIGSDPLEDAAASFEKAGKAVENFNDNLLPLIDRYDQLTAQTTLTTEEQEELNSIIETLGGQIPTAISQFDEYGNAMAINTDKARAYGKALEDNIKLEKQALFAEIEEKRAKQTEILNNAVAQLNTTLDGNVVRYQTLGTAGEGAFTKSRVAIKLTDDEIAKLQKTAKEAQEELNVLEARENLALGRKVDLGDTEKTNTKLLDLEQLRLKSIEELNTIKSEQAEIDDRVARQNIVLIDKVIKDLEREAKQREKNADAIEKEADKAAKAAEKAREEKQKELDDDLEAARKRREADDELAENRRQNELERQKLIIDFQNEQRIAARADDPLGERVGFAKLEIAALEELNQVELASIQKKVTDGVFTVAQGEAAKIELYRDGVEKRAEILALLNLTEADLVKNSLQIFFEANEQYIQAGQQLITAFLGYYNQALNTQLASLSKQREFENEVFNERIEELDKLREQRKITENDYQKEIEKTEKARLAANDRINKEELKAKRQQAVATKAQAVFDITLATLVEVTKVLSNPVLAAIVAALGAVQLATALAVPLPQYRKGTKATPDSEYAMVGEDGPEIVWMPRGSKVLHNPGVKQNPAIVDAMLDNRLDDYIHQNYVAPELIRAEKESRMEREIITNTKTVGGPSGSIYYDVLQAQLDAGRRGSKIKNVDELATAIAREIVNAKSWQ